MNDLPTSAPAGDLPPRPPSAQHAVGADARPAQKSIRRRINLLTALIVLILIAVLAQWWNFHREQKRVRQEVAQRLQRDEALNTETRTLVKSMQDNLKSLQAQASVLENKQQEAQSQQIALSQLYQDLSKNRDDWTLSDIEQTLNTANEQLQLAGNVQSALIALQNAERSLSSSDRAQFFTIRDAIARDIEKLKGVPNVDTATIAVRLDAMIDEIDQLPLLASEQALQKTSPSPAPAQPKEQTQQSSLWNDLRSNINILERDFWNEIVQLIQIRNVQSPDVLLLSPNQAYYLRENVKLSLLNARFALLTRNKTTFQSDLDTALTALNKYFDTRSRAVKSIQAQLNTIRATNLVVDLPNLNDSLSALRNYKSKS